MARLIGDILSPTLRAHYVRPKSLPAILSLRFTSGEPPPNHARLEQFVDALHAYELPIIPKRLGSIRSRHYDWH